MVCVISLEVSDRFVNLLDKSLQFGEGLRGVGAYCVQSDFEGMPLGICNKGSKHLNKLFSANKREGIAKKINASTARIKAWQLSIDKVRVDLRIQDNERTSRKLASTLRFKDARA